MLALVWWYQHFEFPNGVKTGAGEPPGYDARTRWSFIEPFVPGDLTGKTVLDVGGNAGFFSIQMKLRGAQRCVLVDPFEIAIRQAGFAARQFSAGLRIIDRPHRQIIVAAPETYFGKQVFPKLVFPRYGKRGGAVLPGPQRYDAEGWIEISEAIAQRPVKKTNFLVQTGWKWTNRLRSLCLKIRGRLLSKFI